MNPGRDDEELMRALRLGSQEAFAELMARWQKPLYEFFTLMGLDRDTAEDCLQETFLRVFAYRRRYRSTGARFRAFLFRLGRNVHADSLRKAVKWSELQQARKASLEPAALDPVILLNQRFDCESALAALSERLRVVVVLNLFAGLSYREIAAALEIPHGTVKSRMHHALAKLREILHAAAES